MNCINIIEKVKIKYKVAFLILNLFQTFILGFHISTESASFPQFMFLDSKPGYPCRQADSNCRGHTAQHRDLEVHALGYTLHGIFFSLKDL